MAVLPEHLRHPQCLPIVIPDNDPFYRMFNQHCMNFVRTTPGLRPDCNFGYAEQVKSIDSMRLSLGKSITKYL